MKKLLVLLSLLALPLSAAHPKPARAATPPAKKPLAFHLTLDTNPAAPFPFLGKFGATTLHVYPSGLRAETLWLNGFTRNGSQMLTVENPVARLYTDVPIANLSAIVGKLAPYTNDFGEHATLDKPLKGKISKLDATRYRIVYGPDAWIDVWTTTALPDNLALRAIVTEATRGISPATATVLKQIPGLPIYVELNFSHYKKVPILQVKELKYDSAGEEAALKSGALYARAPLLDSLWK